MAKPKAQSVQSLEEKLSKQYRYVCHGCSQNAGWFAEPIKGFPLTCENCEKFQLTSLENFIFDPEHAQ